MLDIKFIRENPQKVSDGCAKKQVKIDIGELLRADKKRLQILNVLEDLRAKKNKASKDIASAKA